MHLDGFPDVWRQRGRDGDIELPLTYRYAPGEPLDGVTIHVPLSGLNQINDDGFDWNVPGHLDQIASTLVRSLPKAIRRSLIPLNDTLDATLERLGNHSARRANAWSTCSPPCCRRWPTRLCGLAISTRPCFPDHLRLNIVVSDDEGEVHAVGTDLAMIKTRLAGSVRASIAQAAPIEERRGIVDWDLGDLPAVVETADHALGVRAYPALLDVGDSVSLRVVTTPELQRRVMHGGVRRLLLLNAAPTRASIERLLDNRDRLALASNSAFAGDISTAALVDDCIAAAVDDVMRRHGALPWTRPAFDELRMEVRSLAPGLAGGAMVRAVAVLRAAAETRELLGRLHAEALRASVDDANLHLGRLVRPGFVLASGIDRLDDIERYVRAITYRLEHLAGGQARDRQRMAEVLPLEHRYARVVDSLGAGQATQALLDVTWQLEELRVATFAQPLAAKRPGQPAVSAKRIAATLDTVVR